MNQKDIYKIFFESAIIAIEMTGDAYKNLSWFARNKKTVKPLEVETKKAA